MNQTSYNLNIQENRQEYKRISTPAWEEKSQYLAGEMI